MRINNLNSVYIEFHYANWHYLPEKPLEYCEWFTILSNNFLHDSTLTPYVNNVRWCTSNFTLDELDGKFHDAWWGVSPWLNILERSMTPFFIPNSILSGSMKTLHLISTSASPPRKKYMSKIFLLDSKWSRSPQCIIWVPGKEN